MPNAQFSLASLPGTALANIFSQLRTTPTTAARLAQTCCSCALEFRCQRSAFVKQRCWDLRPVCMKCKCDSNIARFRIEWPVTSAFRLLHALSSECGALETMWEAVFTRLIWPGLVLIHPTQQVHRPGFAQVCILMYGPDLVLVPMQDWIAIAWSAYASFAQAFATQGLPMTFCELEKPHYLQRGEADAN